MFLNFILEQGKDLTILIIIKTIMFQNKSQSKIIL